MNEQPDPDVLVIGAGPTGLLLAIVLSRLGVRVQIVDRKAGPTRESRAVVLQARTLEIYDQLGLAERMTAASAAARLVAPGYGRRRFGVLPIGELGSGITPFPRLTVLEQSKTESILGEYLAELSVPVQWNTEVEPAHDVADSGSVTVRSPEGSRVIRARYVVGADGSNSLVRRSLGISFDGSTNTRSFFVCDTDNTRGLTANAVNVRLGDAEFLLSFPLGGDDSGGHHRIIGLLPSGGSEIDEEATRATVEQIFGVSWSESHWFSTYRVQHRVASTFRRGRVFFAGDAAHVHSPVGAQGMNTGLQDAHNLAIKIAEVISGTAPDEYLDRYEAERRPVAVRLIATTDRVFGLATSSTSVIRSAKTWRLLNVACPTSTAMPPMSARSASPSWSRSTYSPKTRPLRWRPWSRTAGSAAGALPSTTSGRRAARAGAHSGRPSWMPWSRRAGSSPFTT